MSAKDDLLIEMRELVVAAGGSAEDFTVLTSDGTRLALMGIDGNGDGLWVDNVGNFRTIPRGCRLVTIQ